MSTALAFLQSSPTGIALVDRLLAPILGFAPKIVGAVVLLIVAWIVANIVRWIVRRGLSAVGLDKRLATEENPDTGRNLIGTLAMIAYWVVFLFFLPMILGTLDLGGALDPINALVGKIFGFLPNLLAAAMILVIGFILAGIVRQVITGLLSSLGVNSLAARVGLGTSLGEGGLAGVIGTIVYALIALPVVTAGLNALNLPAVSVPISDMLGKLLGAIPNIFGAALILVIAYFVGKFVCGLVTNILTGIGFNRVPAALGLTGLPAEGTNTASSLAGNLVLVAIMLLAAIEASHILNFALLADIVKQLTEFGGHLIAGLIILCIGLYLAQLAAGLIQKSGMANAGTLATVARAAIIVFVGAMALRRMGLADDIVNMGFSLTLGAVAVAAAIAFGIGGKDFARRLLSRYGGSDN